MQIKTITTAAGVNEIDFGNDDSQTTAHFYWFKNLSDSTLYVSAKPNPVAGGDNVAELPAKGATSVETDEGKVYVLGTGKVEIHRTDSKFCPFELPSTNGGGVIKSKVFTGTTDKNSLIVTDLSIAKTKIINVLCLSYALLSGAFTLGDTDKWGLMFYDVARRTTNVQNRDVSLIIYYIEDSTNI